MIEKNHISAKIKEIVPALRMILSKDGPLRTLCLCNNHKGEADIYSECADIERIVLLIEQYKSHNGRMPEKLMVEGVGLITARPVSSAGRRMENKTVIVTGAGQGFGLGIAQELFAQGANIVVADINETAGLATAAQLNANGNPNSALFVRTDVSNMESIEGLIDTAVASFGGIDVFISNAGVLRAGSLEDMTPEDFEFVTKINYNAFFYCVKAVSKVMKSQNKYSEDSYCDIIQVNSKSGLRGSKANFAYSGGKFGGIGLVQSFALELAPYRIKVNAVCPGNYYEGPLWADPGNGLFVQYLRAGKVPGAKTVDDVREYYMSQVPMGKGTTPADVTKAIMYAVEQECETGQAIPVTGGQVMLA